MVSSFGRAGIGEWDVRHSGEAAVLAVFAAEGGPDGWGDVGDDSPEARGGVVGVRFEGCEDSVDGGLEGWWGGVFAEVGNGQAGDGAEGRGVAGVEERGAENAGSGGHAGGEWSGVGGVG